MSVECCPGIAGSLTTVHVAQFSTPAKREKCWFLFPSKGASHPVVLPHPVFIQTACVFKGYLFCCFEHFTRHITVYSSKGLEYNLVLVVLYWLNPNLFCLSYSSFPVEKIKNKLYHGRGALSGFLTCSLCPSSGRAAWGQQEEPPSSGYARNKADYFSSLVAFVLRLLPRWNSYETSKSICHTFIYQFTLLNNA